jgi:hypothetical protein
MENNIYNIDLEEEKKDSFGHKPFHLAGIIPVHQYRYHYSYFFWDDCFMPIGENILAIEKSIVECAYAGCSNIWIVCSNDVAPYLRYRIGEYIIDPIIFKNRYLEEYRREYKYTD